MGDILSTGYFGAEMGNIQPGETVAVFGSGPVGMWRHGHSPSVGPGALWPWILTIPV